MKIVSMELFKVAPRWLFLKTTADDGTAGWGEPVIEGRADTVAAAVRELAPYVIGHYPYTITYHDLMEMEKFSQKKFFLHL